MALLVFDINILSLLIFCYYVTKAAQRIEFSTGITAPGTKWCGPHNTASSCDDFGLFDDVDRCCRTHDYCDHFIRPKETFHGLYNSDGFTKLGCGCDETFFQCLTSLSGIAAWTIKKAYFGYQRKCFKYDHPIKNCLRYEGFFGSNCVEYELDTTLPKKWQWFDNPQ